MCLCVCVCVVCVCVCVCVCVYTDFHLHFFVYSSYLWFVFQWKYFECACQILPGTMCYAIAFSIMHPTNQISDVQNSM